MAVTFDANNSSIAFPQTQVTISHSLGSGSDNDRIVLACVTAIGGTTHSFVSATYNGTSMTQLAQVQTEIFGGELTLTVFYLLDSSLPSSSGSYNFVYEIDVDAYSSIGHVTSYTGVDQALGFDYTTDFVTTQNPAISDAISTSHTAVTSAGMLVDFLGMWGNGTITGTPDSGQTERLDTGDVDETQVSSEEPFTSSGSESMGWTPSTTYNSWAHLILELPEAGGGGEEESMMFGFNF